MQAKQLIILALLAFGGWYTWQHRTRTGKWPWEGIGCPASPALSPFNVANPAGGFPALPDNRKYKCVNTQAPGDPRELNYCRPL